jgi:hypothetical protein
MTRGVIVFASLTAGMTMVCAALLNQMQGFHLAFLIILSGILFLLAGMAIIKPSDKGNFRLYKYASIYMLSSMLLFVI